MLYLYKRQRKPKGQSKKDNPELLTTLGTQDTGRRQHKSKPNKARNKQTKESKTKHKTQDEDKHITKVINKQTNKTKKKQKNKISKQT